MHEDLPGSGHGERQSKRDGEQDESIAISPGERSTTDSNT
jgi:hypothetical protein